jgi:hypothetical protein
MANIKEIKNYEVSEMLDFYHELEEYGHIYHLDPKLLDEPFKKIMEGITEVRNMMDDSFSM